MPERLPPEIYAALDLGSNSFHLLIAEFDGDKLRIVDRHKDTVRLGAGLDDNDALSKAAMRTALASLAKMAERLRGVPADHIRVAGTNTLRVATNAADFIDQAEATLGATINIISGTEEARLIYLGVASDLALERSQRRLVIDIGGGSTELVAGRRRAELMESVMVGCVSCSQRFFVNGALSEAAFKKAVKACRQELAPYAEGLRDRWQQAVGTSGTIRGIGRILTQLEKTRHDQITADGLRHLQSRVFASNHVDELNLSGLAEDRRAVFPGGLAVLSALFQELDIKLMEVSDYALREGMILDQAGRLHQNDPREKTVAHFMRQYRADTAQAKRVAKLAERWLPGLVDQLTTTAPEALKLLHWAASLHEIGLAIAHGGYHKHGAYILANADMPGFSRQEQARLGFLVLNHRRKLKSSAEGITVKPDWLLIALFRLACIFHRRRQAREIPDSVQLTTNAKKRLLISAPAEWLEANPLTAADLDDERELLATQGIELKIATI